MADSPTTVEFGSVMVKAAGVVDWFEASGKFVARRPGFGMVQTAAVGLSEKAAVVAVLVHGFHVV